MKCPHCKAENPELNQFCGDCGRPLHRRPDVEVNPELHKQIVTILSEEREKWIKDQQAVELDIATKALARIRNWLTFVFIPLTGFIAALGFLGYNNFQDIVNTGQEAIDKAITKAQTEIQQDQAETREQIADVQAEQKKLLADIINSKRMLREANVDALLGQITLVRKKVEGLEPLLPSLLPTIITPDMEAQLSPLFSAFHRYIYELELSGDEEVQIAIAAERGVGPTRSDAAFYDAENKILKISNIALQEKDIVFYQYALSVLNQSLRLGRNGSIGKELMSNTTVADIGSSIAYYLACSFKNEPVFSYGGKTAITLRNGSNFSSYEAKNAFQRSQVWGTLFWDLREAFGKAMADSIVTRAWSNYTQKSLDQMDINGFARELIKVSKAQQGGEQYEHINNAFKARGLVL